jgi:hypothetical protein
MTTSSNTVKPRQSAAERRAAQVATLATQQSDLKREAAERRAVREQRVDQESPDAAPVARTRSGARRPTSR